MIIQAHFETKRGIRTPYSKKSSVLQNITTNGKYNVKQVRTLMFKYLYLP